MPPPRRRQRLSFKRLILGLAGLLILLVFIPRSWLSPLQALWQWIMPVQDAVSAAVDGAASALETAGSEGEASTAAARREQTLRNQLAALADRVRSLEDENRLLRATRVQGGIGTAGRLIAARVVADDVAPWRAVKTLSAGSSRGVRTGDAVVSREFTLDAGADDGLRDGLAVLIGETLLGFVTQTHTLSCRVQFISDPETQMKVRIGRFTEGGFAWAEGEFWLTGQGGGVMVIGDVPSAEVHAGRIAAGDVVLASPDQTQLPAALTVGRVESVSADVQNPLLSRLTVAGIVPHDAVRRVYVYNPDPGE